MFNIQNKLVTVIGAQRSGQALARLIVFHQGSVFLSDLGDDQDIDDQFKQWAEENNVQVEFKKHTKEIIQKSDLIVLSPGVKKDAEPVLWAQEKNIPVLGEVEFAFQFCSKPVIAVTGSNGKTTVSNLINNLVKAVDRQAGLCGNVGYPFSDSLIEDKSFDYYVLEISSFQLETVLGSKDVERMGEDFRPFKPFIAVILNFSRNHLDRHEDMEEYLSAKKRIFLNQSQDDFTVLNDSDAQLKALAKDTNGQVIFFNKEKQDVNDSGNPNYSAVREVGNVLEIDHNTITKVLESFKGIEHRLEWVRKINGVDYVNDSKATTTEAGRWAIRNLEKPILLICGGRDKDADFTVLSQIMAERVRKLIVFGEAKNKLIDVFQGVLDVEVCEGLEGAVQTARQLAEEGDCILLSPMCASFDMFRNYEERGKVFKEIVNKLE